MAMTVAAPSATRATSVRLPLGRVLSLSNAPTNAVWRECSLGPLLMRLCAGRIRRKARAVYRWASPHPSVSMRSASCSTADADAGFSVLIGASPPAFSALPAPTLESSARMLCPPQLTRRSHRVEWTCWSKSYRPRTRGRRVARG